MTSITSILSEKPLKPKFVLVVYGNDQSRDYVELAELNNANEIISTTALAEKTVLDLGYGLIKSSVNKNTIPMIVGTTKREIVFASLEHGEIIFLVPEHYGKYMYNEEEYNVVYPNLLFHVKKHELSLYVVDTLKIDFKTKIVPAILSNVQKGLCMGNIKKKLQFHTLNEMIEYWENVFFNSVFTHSKSEAFFVQFNNPEYKFHYKEYYECQKEVTVKSIITHHHTL